MKKVEKGKKIYTIFSILATILVYLGAVAIYFYAHGWRLDPIAQDIIKTGVLTVESDPFLANLYINGKEEGRTPRSTSLPVGKYDISVKKEEYIEWNKNIEIKEEKSTPIYPWLIKETIEKSNVISLEGKEYINSWISGNRNHIYFLTRYISSTDQSYFYELSRFDTDTAFWDLTMNPKVIFTLNVATVNTINLKLSPNGILGILDINDGISTKYFLIDLSENNNLSNLKEIGMSQYSSYTMSWSKDNKYILLESNLELLSYNIENSNVNTLIQKEEGKEYIWNTDEQSFFYNIEESIPSDTTYSYSLYQSNMNGMNRRYLIEEMNFQKDYKYIDMYRREEILGKYLPFTISPQSTKSVGKIQFFTVDQYAKGIYIQTDTSSYWYSIEENKYLLISPYPTELIQFSMDRYKLIFKDTLGYEIYTFDKENGDHTVEIGAKYISNLGDISSAYWISNSTYIWFTQNNSMYISDKDGENTVKVLDGIDTLLQYTINSAREKAYTLYSKDGYIYLDSYLLR